MASRKAILIVCLLCSVLDISVSTVFFAHGVEFHHFFTAGVYGYSFTGSLFDLWVLSVLRTVVLLGTVLAVILNPRDAIHRIVKLKPFIITISVLIWSFNIIKLLLISEVQNLSQPWLWAMLSWTAVTSALLTVNWILLIKYGQLRGPLKSGHYLIDSKPHENQPSVNSNVPNGNAGKSSPEARDTTLKAEKKISQATLMRLITSSAPDWPILLCGFFFLLAAAVGEIFIPHFTGLVINSIVIDKSYSKFTSAITFMALISLGSAIATGLRGGCFVLAISRLNIRLRKKLFSSIVNQEIGFFDKVRTGDITSRLTSDITTMSDMLGLNINIFLRSSIKAIGVIVFMVKLSWRLTGVTVISMPIIVGVSKLYGSYYKKLAKLVQDSLATANEVAEEVCSSIRTVRSFANEEGEVTRYAMALGDTYRLKKKQAVAYAGYAWCTQLFDLALTVAVLYYGGHLVLNSVITGGDLVTFILYQIELGNCIQNMGAVYTGLMQASGAAVKVFEYIDRQPEINNDGQYKPGSLQGSLEFRNVWFSYPTRPDTPVLKELSFRVSPGEVVALVGPSGGGKSSCVNLLQHFYECGSGQVLLDGVPVQSYSHKYLHQKMALVGQEPVLYARSVFDNIGYGLDNPLQTAVVRAAQLANAHSFITELPSGYSTKSGEKGLQLSGGQKQRVAIARALIRNPAVLILDEATSALDSESEHLVQNAIYQNLKGRTVVIIAHRLSTVERADRIIVIDKGTIIEQGTHSDLLQQGGLYTTLVQHQLLGMDSEISGRGTELLHSAYPVPARRLSSDNLSSSCHSADSISLLHVASWGSKESPVQVSFRIGSQ